MKLAIIMGILTTLLAHEKIKASELAKKYEVSVRTIMRYVEILNASGVPIASEKGRYGGIKIDDNYRLSSHYFTEAEYNRLIPAVKSYDLQDKITTQILDKLTVLSKNLRKNYILTSSQLVVDTPMTQALQNKFALIQDAIVSRSKCVLTYHDNKGEITTRTVEPYSLLLKEGLWYLYAYCLMRKDFRFFKITRIAAFRMTYESFEPHQFNPDFRNDLIIPTQSPYTEFSFKFNRNVLTEVEEWLGIDSVSIINGEYFATAKLPFDNFLISRLLSFGKDITVTAPNELIYKLRKTLFSALQNYTQNSN